MRPEFSEILGKLRARMSDDAWLATIELLEAAEAEVLKQVVSKPREEAAFLRERAVAFKRLRQDMQGGAKKE